MEGLGPGMVWGSWVQEITLNLKTPLDPAVASKRLEA